MTTEIIGSGSSITVKISGRLDAVTAPEADRIICGQAEMADSLTLDLKELEYISSAGLRILLSAQKKMQKKGKMKLVNVNENVMKVLEMTGFADILEIE